MLCGRENCIWTITSNIAMIFFLAILANILSIDRAHMHVSRAKLRLSDVISFHPSARLKATIPSDRMVPSIVYVPSLFSLSLSNTASHSLDDEHFCSRLCDSGYSVHVLDFKDCAHTVPVKPFTPTTAAADITQHQQSAQQLDHPFDGFHFIQALAEALKWMEQESSRSSALPRPKVIQNGKKRGQQTVIVANELSVAHVLTYAAETALPFGLLGEDAQVAGIFLLDPPPLHSLGSPTGRKAVLHRYYRPLVHSTRSYGSDSEIGGDYGRKYTGCGGGDYFQAPRRALMMELYTQKILAAGVAGHALFQLEALELSNDVFTVPSLEVEGGTVGKLGGVVGGVDSPLIREWVEIEPKVVSQTSLGGSSSSSTCRCSIGDADVVKILRDELWHGVETSPPSSSSSSSSSSFATAAINPVRGQKGAKGIGSESSGSAKTSPQLSAVDTFVDRNYNDGGVESTAVRGTRGGTYPARKLPADVAARLLSMTKRAQNDKSTQLFNNANALFSVDSAYTPTELAVDSSSAWFQVAPSTRSRKTPKKGSKATRTQLTPVPEGGSRGGLARRAVGHDDEIRVSVAESTQALLGILGPGSPVRAARKLAAALPSGRIKVVATAFAQYTPASRRGTRDGYNDIRSGDNRRSVENEDRSVDDDGDGDVDMPSLLLQGGNDGRGTIMSSGSSRGSGGGRGSGEGQGGWISWSDGADAWGRGSMAEVAALCGAGQLHSLFPIVPEALPIPVATSVAAVGGGNKVVAQEEGGCDDADDDVVWNEFERMRHERISRAMDEWIISLSTL